MKNAVRCLLLRLELSKLSKKYKKLVEEYKEIMGNNEYLFNEITTFKNLIRKRYITADEKMDFLTKREAKLQLIEQMAKNKEDFRKIRKVIESE